MSGMLIGELILWLIVAIIAIVVIVYIVNWLYHRSSKEVSFVRTASLGERAVTSGGPFCARLIHDYRPEKRTVPRREFGPPKRAPVTPPARRRAETGPAFSAPGPPPGKASPTAAPPLG